MIIEFLGAPGVGKSTAQEHLIKSLVDIKKTFLTQKELESEYVRTYLCSPDSSDALVRLATITTFYPLVWFKHFLACLTSRNYSIPVSYYLSQLSYWLSKDVLLSSFHNTRVLEDKLYLPCEGLAQHSLGLYVWSNHQVSKTTIKLNLSRFSLSNLHIIHLTMAPEVGLDRLIKRGTPRSWPNIFRESHSAIKTIYNRYLEYSDEILSIFVAAGANIHQISADGTVDMLYHKLDNVILTLLSSKNVKKESKT